MFFSTWYSSGTGAEFFHLLSAPGTVKCNPSLTFRMSKHLTHPYKEQWPWEEGRRAVHVIAWFLGLYSSSKKYRFTSSATDERMEYKCFAWVSGNVLLLSLLTVSHLYLIQNPGYIDSSFIPYIFFLSLNDILIVCVFSGINNSELLKMKEFDCCISSLPVLRNGIQLRMKNFLSRKKGLRA